MKMTPVTSSNIAAIGYCEDTAQLAVKFKNGKTFVYSDVSEDEWGLLMLSDSIGKHFNQFIKAVKVGREAVTAENDTTGEIDATSMSDAQMSDKEKIKVLREALELISCAIAKHSYISESGVNVVDVLDIESQCQLIDDSLEATKDGE